MKRRTAREKAVQTLFQIDLGKIDPDEAIKYVLEEEGVKEDGFLTDLVTGTMENKNSIDELIREHLEKWKMERIGNVDRAILRLAVYEMKFENEIPYNVTLNEAIELAKTFGDEESSKFINGVLSKIKDTFER